VNPTFNTRYPRGGDALWTDGSVASGVVNLEFFGADDPPPSGLFLDVTAGSYGMTGQAAQTRWGRAVDTTAAAYAITGSPVELIYTLIATGLLLDVTPGAYAITGSSAGAQWRQRLDVTPAAFTIAGQTVTVRRTYRADVSPGAYTVAGALTSLEWSGETVAAAEGQYTIVLRRRRRR
jgi:hypothetical protein